jgi:hypothetical protein
MTGVNRRAGRVRCDGSGQFTGGVPGSSERCTDCGKYLWLTRQHRIPEHTRKRPTMDDPEPPAVTGGR